MRTEFDSFLIRVHRVEHALRMAVRGVDHQQVDARVDQPLGALEPSSPTLVAAATRRRPCASLAAFGLSCDFSMSLTVMRPTQLPFVDDQQLFDAVLVQQALGLVLVDRFRAP
jgi:hypothetical protein